MMTMWALFILLTLTLSATVSAQNSTVRLASKDLDTGAVDFTTDFTAADTGYLSHVAVNFSAAPEAAETIVVYATNRGGTAYNTELIRVMTVAGSTTSVSLIAGSIIPVSSFDQIRITVTNASQSVGETNDDPTVSVSVTVDTKVRNGTGFTVLRNGSLILTLQHDYRWHTGDIIPDANQEFGAFYSDFSQIAAPANPASGVRRLFVDSGTGEMSVRTSTGLTVSLEADTDTGHVIHDEGTPLTQESILNFTGGGITCSNGSGETTCDVPSAAGDITAVGSCTSGDCAVEGGSDIFPFIYEGSADTFETTMSVTDPTADNAIIFPNLGGTVTLQSGSGFSNGAVPFYASSQLTQDSNLKWDNSDKELGIGPNTPLFDLDISVNSVASQLHISGTAENTGAYFTSTNASSFFISAGAYWDGTNWIATDTVSSAFAAVSGSVRFYADDSLTPGSPFTPTRRLHAGTNGRIGINTITPDGLLDVEDGGIYMSEISAPATPASGKLVVYGKTDNHLYMKNDAGTEYSLSLSSYTLSGGTGSGSGLGTSNNTQYFALSAPSGAGFTADDGVNGWLATNSATIQRLFCRVGTAPANGAGTQSRVFTVRHVGTTDLALTCTISEAATTCSDTSNTATLSAGNLYIFKTTASGTPADSNATCGINVLQ